MVEFMRDPKSGERWCSRCGAKYLRGHMCSTTTWSKRHSGWQRLPDDGNAGEDATLDTILAELRQIRQMLERQR